MHSKEEILHAVQQGINEGVITQEDLGRFYGSKEEGALSGWFSGLSIQRVLYYLGGFIVLLGAGVFIGQFWDDLNSFARILVTLGAAVVAYSLGMYLITEKRFIEMSAAFHLIGGGLFPVGMVVLVMEVLDNPTPNVWFWSGVFAIITVLYSLSYYARNHAILMFFTVAYSTAFIYATFFAILDGADAPALYAYLTLVLGGSYFTLGHYFLKESVTNRVLAPILYFFGGPMALGAPFILMFEGQTFWEVLYIAFIAGAIALSMYLKSNILLIWSTLFVMFYVMYLTGEYFADAVGWPIALIFSGLALIGLGYYGVTLHHKIQEG